MYQVLDYVQLRPYTVCLLTLSYDILMRMNKVMHSHIADQAQ